MRIFLARKPTSQHVSKVKQVKQLELSAIQGKEFDHTGKEVNIIAKMDGLIKEFMAP